MKIDIHHVSIIKLRIKFETTKGKYNSLFIENKNYKDKN